jgi:Zn-dependent protease with chaperone function
MHSLLIASVIAIAVALRWQWQPPGDTWNARWNYALACFCLPPLLLLSAAGAVLVMGHHGSMMGLSVSPVGCWVGRSVMTLGLGGFLLSLAKVLWFQRRLRQYPRITLPSGETVRCLESDRPFAAQVGFWQSQVLVSQGWLTALTGAEQAAVLRHEQAHAYYRDPFWFFWLGIGRRLTLGLPRTEELWQELLLLREIRADRWALQEADPLLLAELLVKLARAAADSDPLQSSAISFCHGESVERLEQRVEALVNPDYFPARQPSPREFAWVLLAMVPLVVTGLHH